MPVKVTVESVLAGKDAFETAKRNAEELNKNLRGQFAERERIIKLQARLSQATSREEKAAIRSEIAERRRGLQLASLKEREERQVTAELKRQISAQQRLNRLTEKLNRDLDQQQKKRSLLGRLGGAGGAAALSAGIGAAAIVGSQALDAAKEAAELGQAQQEARARLTQLLGSTEKYNEAIRTMNELTTVQSSEVENANAAFLLLDSGIAKTVDEAARLANAGSILSQAFEAQGASQEKFLRLLSSGSTALLDNFNLTREQVEARKEAIQATTGLNDEEAKSQAIRELAIEKADELAKSISNSAKAAAEYEAASADLTATIGEKLIPAFTDAQSVAADFFGFLTDRMKAAQEATASGQGVGGISNALVKMEADVAVARIAQAEATETAQDYADAQGEAAEAVEEASEAAEEAAKRLEHIKEVQRDFAKSLLEISERATEDQREQWEDYYSDLADLTDDYADRVADIEQKAGKERVNIGKKLAKDLAKTDSDLNRDREKITADTAKKIKRLQEDAARETQQDRRKRQIDALGDERLFQFELGNLAAEGETLAIKEALERRKIEEQIGAEKRQAEEQAESSDLDVKIQRLRQDAEDQRREEEAQARQRREFLKEQAEEDRTQLEENLTEQKEAEFENLQERLAKLKETNDERLQNIEEARQKANQKLGEELAEAKDLTTRELNDLKGVAGKLGEDVGSEFAQGLSKGFADNRAIDELLDDLKNFAPAGGGRRGGGSRGASARRRRRFQHGGSFIVEGAGGPDSQFVGFMATPGERVDVTPPGRGGGGINISIPISGIGGGVSEAQVEAIAQRHAQALVNELEQMLGA